MPGRPARPCTKPGCQSLSRDGSGRCSDHPKEAWGKKPDAPKRITGRKLQEMREALFQEQPLCVLCNKAGRITPATERDHIIPLTEGGQDVDSNVQGLCKDCHESKSKAERLRARAQTR